MSIQKTIFGLAALNSRKLSPGNESADVGSPTQQAPIAAIEPIQRPKEGVTAGQADDSATGQKPDKAFGDGTNPLRENDEQPHVNELQAAAEAFAIGLAQARRQKAALENLADQLEETIPEGGVSEQTAGLVHTALGTSEVPEIQEAVAVEAFAMSPGMATSNAVVMLRSRARAMGSVIDRIAAAGA